MPAGANASGHSKKSYLDLPLQENQAEKSDPRVCPVLDHTAALTDLVLYSHAELSVGPNKCGEESDPKWYA